MPTWPSTLPDMPAGFSERQQQGFVRTPMDTGPAKARRRYSAVSRFIGTDMVLTSAQRSTLSTFFTTTLAQGTTAFDWVDPNDKSVPVKMRFVRAPVLRHISGDGANTAYYSVRLELEILP